MFTADGVLEKNNILIYSSITFNILDHYMKKKQLCYGFKKKVCFFWKYIIPDKIICIRKIYKLHNKFYTVGVKIYCQKM